MEQSLREDAEMIVKRALEAVKPDKAVRRCLEGKEFPGRVYLVAWERLPGRWLTRR